MISSGPTEGCARLVSVRGRSTNRTATLWKEPPLRVLRSPRKGNATRLRAALRRSPRGHALSTCARRAHGCRAARTEQPAGGPRGPHEPRVAKVRRAGAGFCALCLGRSHRAAADLHALCQLRWVAVRRVPLLSRGGTQFPSLLRYARAIDCRPPFGPRSTERCPRGRSTSWASRATNAGRV